MSHNVSFIALLSLLMFVVGCAGTKQTTYLTADDAVNALVAGVNAHDMGQLEKIFGPGGDEILDSGDDVADRQAGQKFVDAYNQKHQLTTNDDGSLTLVVGNEDWPLPMPLVKTSGGKWMFDTAAGKDEIVNRRIGRNELDVIQVCKAICDAEQEYAQNGTSEYAWNLISDSGKKNGLYWPTAPGEPLSPLGELVAKAAAEGYSIDPTHREQPHPYHGYIYGLLTSQGSHAPGGEIDFVINGKLVGGFAVIAWPADYGNSGIMTFICNYNGDVYQKDLGDDTSELAGAIKTYDPDPTWKKAD